MDESNLNTMFDMLDSAGQGYITLPQYKGGKYYFSFLIFIYLINLHRCKPQLENTVSNILILVQQIKIDSPVHMFSSPREELGKTFNYICSVPPTPICNGCCLRSMPQGQRCEDLLKSRKNRVGETGLAPPPPFFYSFHFSGGGGKLGN